MRYSLRTLLTPLKPVAILDYGSLGTFTAVLILGWALEGFTFGVAMALGMTLYMLPIYWLFAYAAKDDPDQLDSKARD